MNINLFNGNKEVIEFYMIDESDIRSFCIAHDYYTKGTIEDYNSLMKGVTNFTRNCKYKGVIYEHDRLIGLLVFITTDIINHSDLSNDIDSEVVNILSLLRMEVVSTLYEYKEIEDNDNDE